MRVRVDVGVASEAREKAEGAKVTGEEAMADDGGAVTEGEAVVRAVA